MRVLLVAEESAGVRVLRTLVAAGHEVIVWTAGAGPGFRGATVGEVAAHLGRPVYPADRVRDAASAERVRADGIELLLNVHSLRIVHPAVLAAPRIGAFNLHPGPLPECAGLNAPSWAIYHRAAQHGVTLHWMTAGVDRGAIAYQERFTIAPEETALSLGATCIRIGVELVGRLMADAAGGEPAIPALPQDPAGWRYFGRAVPQQGWIDWTRSAAEVSAFVRACDYGPFPSPWGMPRWRVGNREFGIRKVGVTARGVEHVAPGTIAPFQDGLAVATADAWVRLEDVRYGGRPVALNDLIGAAAARSAGR